MKISRRMSTSRQRTRASSEFANGGFRQFAERQRRDFAATCEKPTAGDVCSPANDFREPTRRLRLAGTRRTFSLGADSTLMPHEMVCASANNATGRLIPAYSAFRSMLAKKAIPFQFRSEFTRRRRKPDLILGHFKPLSVRSPRDACQEMKGFGRLPTISAS